MPPGADVLATFLREHADEILARWNLVRAGATTGDWPRAALRDELARVLDELAVRLVARAQEHAEPRRDEALLEHALACAGAGPAVTSLTHEMFELRDAIEQAWPPARGAEARESLRALRVAMDQLVLEAIERLGRLRTGVLEAVDTIVREHRPECTLEVTLERILRVLLASLGGATAGVDAIAILLIEPGDVLRVRAAIGPEEPAMGIAVRVGEGFAGQIAARREPLLLRAVTRGDVLVNRVLRQTGIQAVYGVPLVRGDELLGVAHMGSSTAPDFAPDTMALFRAIMERVASVLHVEVLRERLEIERARSEAFVANAPTILFTKDTAGRYLQINDRALVDLGLDPASFVGRTDEELFPPELAKALRASDLAVLDAGRALEFEHVFAGADEDHLYLTVKFPIRDARGRITLVGGIATEITERARRMRAQQLLAELGGLIASSLDQRELLSRFAELVVPAVADGVIVALVQPDGSRQGIVRHRDAVVSDRTRALEIAEAALRVREPRCVCDLAPAQLDELGQTDEDRRLLRALAPVSMIQLPLGARGRDLGTMILLRGRGHRSFGPLDLRLAEAMALRMSLGIDNAQLYETSRRASRSREEVLGIVAHDLRNPLGTIALSAQSLVHRLAPEADRERRGLAAIARAAAEMEKLVADLLDHYAIERGEIAVAVRRCSASGLVDEAAGVHRERVEAAGLTLEVLRPDELPDVMADHDRILQVLGNLIGNAVKFTPAGGRVTIGAIARDGAVELYVRDTGVGFSAEAARHVFDRYWKADRADRRGVGLGLAISKGIVDAHGGRIWAVSTPGGGTTISFTLSEALPQSLGLVGAGAS